MVDKALVDYIKDSLSREKSKEEIYLELLKQGKTVDVIQQSFGILEAETGRSYTQRRTILIVVTVGAILIGAGIFSLIASNWQVIAEPMRIALIVISMLAAYGGGWYLRENTNLSKTGGAFLLLGSFIYGAGIFLIAQMFHIRANWPDGFILWMIGTMAMAWALEALSLFALAAFLGIVALVGHQFGLLRHVFEYDRLLVTSTLLLLASTIVTFLTGRRMHKRAQRAPGRS